MGLPLNPPGARIPGSTVEAQKLRSISARWWIGTALGSNLILAGVILVVRGADVHGVSLALAATARVAFLWFFAAYTGGPLAALFGPRFQPLKILGRELGLAFAAALLVHLALVGWLCWIGAPPPFGVFAFFGPVAGLTFILAILSFGNLRAMIGTRSWQLMRIVAMNVILYAFLKDFLQHPLGDGIRHIVEYLPFVAMGIAAPLLRLTAWTLRIRHVSNQLTSSERLRNSAPIFPSDTPKP